MAFNTGGAVSGAIGGASSGAAMGGPWGALIGAGVGGVAGGFGGSPKAPGFDASRLTDIYNDRERQISGFANALQQARTQYYQTTLPNYQKYAMGRFMPQIEANLAGRGLQVNGGAFGSALARQAGDFQAQQSLGQYQDTRNDLNSVNNAYAGNSNSYMGSVAPNLANPAPNNTAADFAGLAGRGLSYLMSQQRQPQGSVVTQGGPVNSLGHYAQ